MNATTQAHHDSPQTATEPLRATERPWARFRRPSINITPAERFGRIAIGAFAAVAGVVLLTSAASTPAVALEVLLIAAGLDLVVTGALGHCPLYRKLGYVPRSLRRTS
jgi:Protein of unknown function (DUF2892)